MCLDPNGLVDGNDGPFRDEAAYLSEAFGRSGKDAVPVKLHDQLADVLWVFDMRDQDHGVGTFPHVVACGSPLVVGDILYVPTSNGVDWSHLNIPNPRSPGLIALDKKTGKLLGEEYSRISERVLHASWGSATLAKANGKEILAWVAGRIRLRL